ncbi:MAG: transcriptional regulator [Terracidiphilus sp.]
MTASALQTTESLHNELWTSLASLLRSYTALHGLHRNGAAAVEHSEKIIRVCHGEKFLVLARDHEIITWTRENGNKGIVELTEAGNLRASDVEQPMDLAAEHWARELMQ